MGKLYHFMMKDQYYRINEVIKTTTNDKFIILEYKTNHDGSCTYMCYRYREYYYKWQQWLWFKWLKLRIYLKIIKID